MREHRRRRGRDPDDRARACAPDGSADLGRRHRARRCATPRPARASSSSPRGGGDRRGWRPRAPCCGSRGASARWSSGCRRSSTRPSPARTAGSCTSARRSRRCSATRPTSGWRRRRSGASACTPTSSTGCSSSSAEQERESLERDARIDERVPDGPPLGPHGLGAGHRPRLRRPTTARTFWRGVLIDISAERGAKLALEDAHERHRGMIDAMPACSYRAERRAVGQWHFVSAADRAAARLHARTSGAPTRPCGGRACTPTIASGVEVEEQRQMELPPGHRGRDRVPPAPPLRAGWSAVRDRGDPHPRRRRASR